MRDVGRNLGGIVLPDGVTSIGSNVFGGCTAMAYATIGSGITQIPEDCFSRCSSLAEIIIPATVDSIHDGAFYGCTSLRNVIISDRTDLLVLGSNYSDPLFSSCPLDSVYIGGNLSYPTESDKGYSPFYRNTSLRTVKITDKETEISENEFYGCTNLRNVTLGDGIESIGNYAISGCAALERFTFGSSVKEIGEEAFSDCTAMTELVSNTTVPPVCGTQALDDINKWTCQLYVPGEAIDAYKAADQWKEFFFIQTGIDHVTQPDDAATRLLQGRVQVFNLSGQLQKAVEHAATVDDILNGLAPGMYILKGSGVALKVINR